jgi:HK97 family phage major capsid protein
MTGELELKNVIGEVAGAVKNMQSQLADALTKQSRIQGENEQLRSLLDGVRKGMLGGGASRSVVRRPGQFVSEECARYLAAVVILGADRNNKLKDLAETDRSELIKGCSEIVGMERKTALTTSDIPLPVTYASEVVELVWEYGQARRYGTVYPMGAGSAKLPKLGTSPAFGFITASAAVGEKSPGFSNVDFVAEKAGGIIRIPSEIDMDSIVPLGQFLARYIAREMAKWEDTVFFTADGSGTYKSMTGLTEAALANSKNVTLATGVSSPPEITLANMRSLRAKVNSAALPTSAYYANATMEPLFSSFNTSATVKPFTWGPDGYRLDGYPVRWVDVLPIYDTADAEDQLQLLFGDASYQYLGVRQSVQVETSADVYFATDELAVRALERFCVALMASDAVAVLQLGPGA